MNSPRPKLGWIYQKSCFNQLKDSEDMHPNHLVGISSSERLGYMFESGLYSDCSFLVEDQEIRAHKLILAAASPKMEKMLLGPEVNQIELVSVPYSLRVMQLILKHVYLQDMDIESIDEAQDVIEAACFFEMNDLVELCCAGIEPETLNELWPALNLACLYNSRALKEACLALALQNSHMLIHHEGLLHISPEALAFLLSREVIEINSELEVINISIAWAQVRLKNSEDNSNLRLELETGGVLKQLRILSLIEPEFVGFITGAGKDIFSDIELDRLEYNYFSDTCESYISTLRTERMLEKRVPICGTDYLAVNCDNDYFSVNVKVHESSSGVRPIIKMIILPSQINPANILYDNVSHKTHYTECVLVEISVNGKFVGRGSFNDRIKYGDDLHIGINTFNVAPMYASVKYDEEHLEDRFYEAKMKISFKKHGYYPLAVETKSDENAVIVLDEPCRFIHEFILTSPRT